MGEYQAPTAAQVQEAMRRLTSFQLRRAFYEGLKNPLWVRLLADYGAFSSPPEPEVGSDGSVRDRYWPEASYLEAMAEHAPSDVADVLVTFSGSSNSWVRRTVFVAGSRMPASIAVRLKPVIKAWAGSGFGWRTDPSDLVSFAVNLLEGGQRRFGVWFANRLFRPTGEKGASGDPVAELRAYWYSEELPRVTGALGEGVLKIILPWLVLYEKQARSLGEGYDYSGFGRSLISERPNSYHEVQDALIDAVRDAALEQLDKNPAGAWADLNRRPILIVRRICLYSAAEVLQRQVAHGDVNTDLLSIARELMFDVKLRDQRAIPDFIRLLRALGAVARTELDPLADVLASGHVTEQAAARITRNLREQGDSSEEIQVQIAQQDRQWRHQVLAGVGRDLLPGALQEELDLLDTEDGVVDDSMRPAFQVSVGWAGPNSPITEEEMAAFAPMELVAHLEGWHDEGGGWEPRPSHEGQARLLEALITTTPLALDGQRDLSLRLRPSYVRAALSGWEGALKADLELPWGQVLSTASDVLEHADESDFPVEGGRFDDDPDYTEAKKVAIRLLANLAAKGSAERIPELHLNQLAVLLLAAASDAAAWREYVATFGKEEPEWDPFMVSLNSKWPILLRGLVNLVGLGASREWHDRTLETLKRQLALDDPRGASRAVLGEGIGKLFNHAHDWLVANLSTYFGTREVVDRNQQIALTTAIAVHYYHPDLYQLLSGPMAAALHIQEQIEVGWGNQVSPQERIGQWVVAAVIRADIGDDDPLRTEFYTAATPGIRGDAIGHTAWSFMHAEVVDDVVRDRLADLWDERVAHVRSSPEDKAELKGFYWFIRSERFPSSWWLPRLVEALELDSELQTQGMIGEQLASAAEEAPEEALKALTLRLSPREAAAFDSYDLRTHALAPVIVAAFRTADDKLHTGARALMNQVGAQGETDLDKRVAVLLADAAKG